MDGWMDGWIDGWMDGWIQRERVRERREEHLAATPKTNHYYYHYITDLLWYDDAEVTQLNFFLHHFCLFGVLMYFFRNSRGYNAWAQLKCPC